MGLTAKSTLDSKFDNFMRHTEYVMAQEALQAKKKHEAKKGNNQSKHDK